MADEDSDRQFTPQVAEHSNQYPLSTEGVITKFCPELCVGRVAIWTGQLSCKLDRINRSRWIQLIRGLPDLLLCATETARSHFVCILTILYSLLQGKAFITRAPGDSSSMARFSLIFGPMVTPNLSMNGYYHRGRMCPHWRWQSSSFFVCCNKFHRFI